MDEVKNNTLMELAAALTRTYAANGYLTPEGAAKYFRDTMAALNGEVQNSEASATQDPVVEQRVPAVPIEESVTDDYIVCLEDGKKFKMLKRHLRSAYGLTPEQYRERWNLPGNYPMVAPNYSRKRSAYAKKAGLGTHDRGEAANVRRLRVA